MDERGLSDRETECLKGKNSWNVLLLLLKKQCQGSECAAFRIKFMGLHLPNGGYGDPRC